MKKVFGLGAFFCLLQVSWLTAQDQDFQRHSALSATVAYNGWQGAGWLGRVVNADELVSDFDINITPTYGLTYDYAFNRWFSLGAAASYNRFTIKSPEINVQVYDSLYYNGYISGRVGRTNLSARALLHYTDNPRFDIYSGVRLGASIWRTRVDVDTTTNIPGVDILNEIIDWKWLNLSYTGTLPSVQVIPIGFRGYITPNLALGVETGIGSPQIAAAQLTYRF